MTEERLGYLLSRASKTIKTKLLTIVSEYGLTHSQYGILRQVYEQEGISARDLVDRLYMDSSTVMAIIDRLEKKALIRRIPHETDRRMNRLVLTDRAKEVIPELFSRTTELDRAMDAVLSPEENTVLRRSLTKLYEFAVGIRIPDDDSG